MKYCTKCGQKLPQNNPKHCPECGAALQPEQTTTKVEAPMPLGDKLRLFGVWFLAIILFFAIIISPFASWDRAQKAGAQYYQYLTAATNDLNDLDFLNKQYNSMQFGNATSGVKASIAADYALKAKQAVVTWGYFKAFIQQNSGSLAQWGVSTASTQTKIDNGKETMASTARSMAFELERNSVGTADALKTLKELGGQ